MSKYSPIRYGCSSLLTLPLLFAQVMFFLGGGSAAQAAALTATASPTSESAGTVKIFLSFQYEEGEFFLPQVRATTSDGNALAGMDYQAFDGNITVNEDAIIPYIEFQITDDAFAEPSEVFQVAISWMSNSGPTAGIWLGPALVTVTIRDDDAFRHVVDLTTPTPSAADFATYVKISGDIVATAAPYDFLIPNQLGVVYLHSATTGELLQEIRPPAGWPQNDANYPFGRILKFEGDRLLIGAAPSDGGFNHPDKVFEYQVDSGTPIRQLPTGWDISVTQTQTFETASWELSESKYVVAGDNKVNVYERVDDSLALALNGYQLLAVSSNRMAVTQDLNTIKIYDISGVGTSLHRTFTLPDTVVNLYSAAIDGDALILAGRFNNGSNIPRVWVYNLATFPALLTRSINLFGGYDAYGPSGMVIDTAIAETDGGMRAYYTDTLGQVIILETIDGNEKTYAWSAANSDDTAYSIAADGEEFVVGLPYHQVDLVEDAGMVKVFSFAPAEPLLPNLILIGGECWEGGAPALLTARIDAISTEDVTFYITTRDETAIGGMSGYDALNDETRIAGDYQKVSNPGFLLVIPAGQLEVTYAINLGNDRPNLIVQTGFLEFGPLGAASIEEDEIFYVDANNVIGANYISTGAAEFIIHDDNDAFIWALLQRGLDVGDPSPDLDRDLNGIPDIIDWTFAGDNINALFQRLPQTEMVPSGFGFSFELSGDQLNGLTLYIEQSPDLVEWTEVSRRLANGPWIGQQPTIDEDSRWHFTTIVDPVPALLFWQARVIIGQPE